jgi:hypothetical protein
VEYWWDYKEGRDARINIPQCHCVHYNPKYFALGLNPGLGGKSMNNRLTCDAAELTVYRCSAPHVSRERLLVPLLLLCLKTTTTTKTNNNNNNNNNNKHFTVEIQCMWYVKPK